MLPVLKGELLPFQKDLSLVPDCYTVNQLLYSQKTHLQQQILCV